ncbi:hypothetical protein JOB18_040220 [Solea senegalensis]|uniref:Uncharacterized protein n=1 Tax=Solea senegalensis TaxID=28829 RepID=A0AAV6R8X7_SOLSE|nr:hypothetical protein JOB18_040220 [Solea senegalensis]
MKVEEETDKEKVKMDGRLQEEAEKQHLLTQRGRERKAGRTCEHSDHDTVIKTGIVKPQTITGGAGGGGGAPHCNVLIRQTLTQTDEQTERGDELLYKS